MKLTINRVWVSADEYRYERAFNMFDEFVSHAKKIKGLKNESLKEVEI